MLSVASVIIEDWQGEQQAGWKCSTTKYRPVSVLEIDVIQAKCVQCFVPDAGPKSGKRRG